MKFQPKYDKFCWVCCLEGTNQNCWSCERTFHVECTKENITEHEWLCPVCVLIKAATIADKYVNFDGMNQLSAIGELSMNA